MSKKSTSDQKTKSTSVPSLSREIIIEAAIKLINENGSAEFSMRSLASKIGVYPTALYWHVGDRAELLSAIGLRWLAGVIPPYELDNWRSWMTKMAYNYRAACYEAPNIAFLIGSHILNDAGALSIAEAMTAHLVAAGFSEEELVPIYNALTGAIVGFIAVEFARPTTDAAKNPTNVSKISPQDISAVDFPYLSQRVDSFIDNAFSLRSSNGVELPLTSSFEMLLETILTGLDARLPNELRRSS